jgi:hypothetical protein
MFAQEGERRFGARPLHHAQARLLDDRDSETAQIRVVLDHEDEGRGRGGALIRHVHVSTTANAAGGC